MTPQPPQKTMVVWRRFGKEHGETDGFRVNPPEVVTAHIDGKLDAFRETPVDQWRWWQVSEDVLIERQTSDLPPELLNGPRERTIYYLPARSLALEWRPGYVNSGREWEWYVHVGDMSFDQQRECWVFTDLFADVLVDADNATHGVYDLDDLAYALEIGLVDDAQVARVLRATQWVVDLIRSGGFPPEEILGHELNRPPSA